MSLTVTDLFAGAGGSSTGMASIPGIVIDQAANHWRLACEIHNANHPNTDHAAVDLHEENPAFFRRTDILWASPECTKWSQANGSSLPAIEEGLFEDPLSSDAAQRSRLLMFDVLRYADFHRYRMMIIENVAGMAFPATYDWDVRDAKGKLPTNRDLVKAMGNAVCPPCSRDIIAVCAETLTGVAA